jgi:hypothetical protein
LLAYVHPDCPEILGEIEPGFEHVLEDVPVVGLVVRPSENRSWDFRPFGQSLAVRKRRVARRFAERAVADDACAGAKCAVRMGSRAWLAVL